MATYCTAWAANKCRLANMLKEAADNGEVNNNTVYRLTAYQAQLSIEYRHWHRFYRQYLHQNNPGTLETYQDVR